MSAMPALLGTIHAFGLLTCFALLGTSRIGACIRSGTAQQLLWEIITLDVTAKPGAELVPYRAEIRGLVAFDYTVRSLTRETT